ncbi:MAG TPA: LEPR-XLL domain-containing protein, partial [Xanthobacteraceae bacterium]|nr:LEPR-XLL domain-containing protein [Xanthobacteraceae bacterium]
MLDKVVRDLFRGKDRSKHRRTGPAPVSTKPRRPNFALEVLEPRLLLSADPVVSLNTNTGVLTAQLTDTADTAVVALNQVATPSGVAADGGLIIDLTINGVTQQYGDANAGVTSIVLQGLGGDDDFTLVEALPIEVTIDGGADNDTIHGPVLGTEWTIDGAGSGSANGITSFTGIENLVGGSDTTDDRGSDIFTFQALGSISGTVDGGGGVDMLVGPDAANLWIVSGPDAGTLNAAANFVSIEALAGGSADDTFKVMPGGAISAFIDGGTSPDGLATPSVDTLDYSGFAAAVTVDLSLGAATGVGANFGIDNYIGSGAAADLFKGPGTDGDSIPWTISGPDAGSVQGVSFSSFANLTGQDGTADAFFFTKTGSLSGTLDGGGVLGDGIVDGLAVSQNVAGDDVVALIPQTINPGTATIDGRTINYVGLDPYSPVGGDASHRVITGSAIDDKIVVEDAHPGVDDGKLLITFQNVAFSLFGLGTPTSSFEIDSPVASGVPGDDPPSLTIITGAGGDTITIKSLDPLFAADLLIYGSYPGTPTPEPDAAHDVVRFEGDVYTHGGYLEVFADDIIVNPGKTLSTLVNTTLDAEGKPVFEDGSNDIVFRARR